MTLLLVSRFKRLTCHTIGLVKRLTFGILNGMWLTTLANRNCSIARTLDVVGEVNAAASTHSRPGPGSVPALAEEGR